MLTNFFETRPIKILYGLILPITMTFTLLFVSSIIKRQYLGGSPKTDFFIRFLFCLWFSGVYFRLSRIITYSIYPNIRFSKSDVVGSEKYLYICFFVLLAIGSGFLSWWMTIWFFPLNSIFAGIFAVVNGLIIFLPLVSRYWVFKI